MTFPYWPQTLEWEDRGAVLIQVLLWGSFGIAAVVCLWPAGRRMPKEVINATSIALGMAFLAWPIVAMTLDVSPLFTSPPTTLNSDEAGRWTAAASAVFFPALIAAPLGAVAVERHARLGGFFTFVLALIAAISSVSVLPTLLGEKLEIGYFCMGACGPFLTSAPSPADLPAGIQMAVFFPFAPLFEPVSVLVLAVGVAIWTDLVRALQAGAITRPDERIGAARPS